MCGMVEGAGILPDLPARFQDSNGDGIGDIPGMIARLDYLKWLGVGAVWLCPVYDSPNTDMGYDIRDYEKIMSEFGTMEDFDTLLREMHKRDIKLVMDLVVNHSSDEHAWFVESRKSRDNPCQDYYIWRDGKNGREPNNWSSFFTPSAWSYDEKTGQWYLHLFSEKQPDLNWENPKLREAVYAMMNRWFDRGVDGFRMDVISLIAKAPGLPDGQGDGYVFAPEQFAFQPKLHEYLREMRRRCFDGRDCMCVGETTFVTPENANSVVGDGRELDLLFQFDFMDLDGRDGKWNVIPFDLRKFKQLLVRWQEAIDWNTLFWGNHDQPRAASRWGDDSPLSAKMLAICLLSLQGTPYIYEGDELGMTNAYFKDLSQYRDIESLNAFKELTGAGLISADEMMECLALRSRDNARTPVQWDDSPNAGFTTGTPWIEVNPNYTAINAAAEEKDPDSVLNYYKQMITLRKSHLGLIYGSFQLLAEENPQVFAYRRTLAETGENYLIACNFSDKDAAFTIPADFAGARRLIGNYPDTAPTGAVTLRPYEAFVLQK